ncbi:MAG: dTMP kinase [archaeon]|nr:dTMP kinase [archaeon]MCR4323779.1 dTMP kinase [Nanoarchaeota archaeon]
MPQGKFIVLEGINGCGKGTQFVKLHKHILDSGKAVPIFSTGEPNDFDENGRMARRILGADGDPYSNNVEAVRYFARNRTTHNQIFNPLLDWGVTVLSDRYWHSNFAFQHAQGIPYEDIAIANRGSRVPDLTLLIDVPAEVATKRLQERDSGQTRKFDRDVAFLEQVRQNYLELPRVLPGLIGDSSLVIIDGNRPIEEVWKEVKNS